jgi:PHD/YefM family antitoxin component YafN of YafNO toxin-antitoxin module
MSISEQIFLKNPNVYLDKAMDPGNKIVVQTAAGEVALINAKELSGLIETAYLNGIPGTADKIIRGMNAPIEECAELDWENEL